MLTSCLDLLQQIFPDLVNRDTPVVNLSRENKKTLSVHLEGITVPLNDIIQTVVVERPRTRCVVLSSNTRAIQQRSQR